ncbi:MAG: hypothetical protein V1494_03250 [Candidatus Diapherotrites archaeon]
MVDMDLFKQNYLFLIGLIIGILSAVYFNFQSIVLQAYVEPFFSQISIILAILFGFAFYLFRYANANWKEEEVTRLFNQIFQFVLAGFLVLLLVNEFYPVDAIININYVLVMALFFGIISVLISSGDETRQQKEEITGKDLIMVIGAGIAGGFLVFIKTTTLGLLGLFISVVAALLIIILSYLLLSENDCEQGLSGGWLD